MPAYTHLQRAEPVLVAHWLLAYVEMFLRDADRLADCRKRLNLCPLGSGAVAGATLPLDRRAMAVELGFDAPTANSIDATSDRDFVLEFVERAFAAGGAPEPMGGRDDFVFDAGVRVRRVCPRRIRPAAAPCRRRRMPTCWNSRAAKPARIIGDATALLVTVKGLPLAYNKDMQETQEPLFDAPKPCLRLLPLVTGWMKAVEFNHERMQEAAQSGFMNAWAAATYLVERGVPFRLAHEQIGKAVQICIDKKCELQDLPLEELRQLNPSLRSGFLFRL